MESDRHIVYLNPRDLLPSRRNVRSDPGDLAGLAETIREHGILQPLGVRREGDGHRVVYGNRRREAAIVVGLNRVPCMIIDAPNDEDVVVQQILENLQRLDLGDMDKSHAFEQLLVQMGERGLDQTEALDLLARTLGLSTRQIQRYLRLGRLSPRVQQLIADGELGVTHGQHLVDIVPSGRQEAIAALAVEESLSAAELSRLCASLRHNGNIDPALALTLQRRGEPIPDVAERPREAVRHFGPVAPEPGATLPPWDEDDEPEPGPKGPSSARAGDALSQGQGKEDRYAYLEPATRDGNRVRRIHSMDAFMDELQRLAVCVQEGDLQRLLGDDEASAVKLGMAERQLHFLLQAIAALRQSSASLS